MAHSTVRCLPPSPRRRPSTFLKAARHGPKVRGPLPAPAPPPPPTTTAATTATTDNPIQTERGPFFSASPLPPYWNDIGYLVPARQSRSFL